VPRDSLYGRPERLASDRQQTIQSHAQAQQPITISPAIAKNPPQDPRQPHQLTQRIADHRPHQGHTQLVRSARRLPVLAPMRAQVLFKELSQARCRRIPIVPIVERKRDQDSSGFRL
jgi:hypothetical protein